MDFLRQIPFLTVFAVIAVLVGLVYAIRFFILAVRANPKRIPKKLKKVDRLIEQGKFIKALEVLDTLLQDVGYNYRAARQKKRSMIYDMVNFLDLEPAFSRLTQVLSSLGRGANNLKIYEDMLNFIAELDDVTVGKGVKHEHTARVYRQMAQHYFDERDFRAAVTHEAMAQVEELIALRMLGKMEELRSKRPIRTTEIEKRSLEALGLGDQVKAFELELNAALPEKIEEASSRLVQTRVFDFLKNAALLKSAKEKGKTPAAEAVSDILSRNLADLTSPKKKEDDSKPPEEKKDVILL
ncbi:MAG: hypothetical protein D6812_01945 [Deltaproteobacteria bacterium]|nr:MAG: hypothetical protein D6812_01945 [Deltaproteobacteria bacterium]